LTALALLGIQLSLLVLWASHSTTRASTASAILSLLDAIAILALSIFEHARSVRPSSLLSIYLVVSALFDATQLRTLYLRAENHAILAVLTVSIAIKVILFLLENHNKRSYLRAPYQTWSPEVTGGIVNRTFFWWLNPLFRHGFSKNLSSGDLYFMDPDLLSESLEDQMEAAWAKCMQYP
jgi:ATP-binding cassette, subfamily C (CFTR/MRP), member 1